MWSTPAQRRRAPTACSRNVCGLRKSSRRNRSATTIAERAVRREVEVVGIGHRDRRPRPAGARVDRGEHVALIVGHVQRPQVVRRDDMLRLGADCELPHDAARTRIDLLDRVAQRVGDVDQRPGMHRRAGQHVGAVGGVDVERRRVPRYRRRADTRHLRGRERARRRGVAGGSDPAAGEAQRQDAAPQDDGDGQQPPAGSCVHAGQHRRRPLNAA